MTRDAAARFGLTLLVAAGGLCCSSCDERFEYDIPRGGAAGGGAAGSSSGAGSGAAGQAGATLGGGGGGGGGASQACGAGPACPSGLSCVGGACVECATDSDCTSSGRSRCEPTLHRCVQCLLADDCPADSGCDRVANHCLETCSEDLPCPPEAHGCDEKRMVCYACDEDRECEDSTLGPYCAADGSGCVECRGEEGCAADQHCDDLTGTCVACRDGRDCDSGLCEPISHTCLAAP